MTDKYEIYEYEDGFKRVLKNGKAINEFGLLKDVQKLQAENAELRKQVNIVARSILAEIGIEFFLLCSLYWLLTLFGLVWLCFF